MAIRSFPEQALRDAMTAAAIAFIAALFIAAPAAVRTYQEASWCSESTTDLGRQIKGCTALIQSGLWSQKYLAFAYNTRGAAYQTEGKFERAIEDYSEAIRLDAKYAFVCGGHGSAYLSAQLRGLGVVP